MSHDGQTLTTSPLSEMNMPPQKDILVLEAFYLKKNKLKRQLKWLCFKNQPSHLYKVITSQYKSMIQSKIVEKYTDKQRYLSFVSYIKNILACPKIN